MSLAEELDDAPAPDAARALLPVVLGPRLILPMPFERPRTLRSGAATEEGAAALLDALLTALEVPAAGAAGASGPPDSDAARSAALREA